MSATRAEIEARILRMARSDAARERVQKAAEEAQDWRGRCRRCGAEIVGPLTAFKAHKCEVLNGK